MRDEIIDIANKMDIKVAIVNMSIDELHVMDELFITNSLIGMKVVTKLGDSIYKDQVVTNMIFAELLKTKEDYAQAV